MYPVDQRSAESRSSYYSYLDNVITVYRYNGGHITHYRLQEQINTMAMANLLLYYV